MLARSTPHAVIQPKPGIGDVIWHLPFIRAIAAVSPGGQVTFLAPPTSGARELLVAEPAVAETIYFNHSGSELQRGVNLIRLVALFDDAASTRFRFRPHRAPGARRVPRRHPGAYWRRAHRQRRFITNPGIPQSHFHNFPIEWLVKLMADMGVPFTTTQPGLRIPSEALAAIGEKFASLPRPWLVLEIAASHPDKDWPAAHWKELIDRLRELTPGLVFLIGGAANIARADDLIANTTGAGAINDWA